MNLLQIYFQIHVIVVCRYF